VKKLVFIAAVATAAIFPAGAFAAFNGVVVGKSPGTIAVASKGGLVHTVKTRAPVRVGARVRVTGAVVRFLGRAHAVRIRAVVVRRAGASTLLAGGRSLFAVRSGRGLASVLQKPTTGSVVTTTATVSPSGQLTAGATQVVGHVDEIEVEALVTGVAPGSITLSVGGHPFTISLPAGIQLPASLVGQTVKLELKLAGAEPVANEDENEQGEDNDQGDNDDQGDDGDERGDDGDHGGHGGDDDGE
jgi:hypothetical protein